MLVPPWVVVIVPFKSTMPIKSVVASTFFRHLSPSPAAETSFICGDKTWSVATKIQSRRMHAAAVFLKAKTLHCKRTLKFYADADADAFDRL